MNELLRLWAFSDAVRDLEPWMNDFYIGSVMVLVEPDGTLTTASHDTDNAAMQRRGRSWSGDGSTHYLTRQIAAALYGSPRRATPMTRADIQLALAAEERALDPSEERGFLEMSDSPYSGIGSMLHSTDFVLDQHRSSMNIITVGGDDGTPPWTEG